MLEQKLIVTEAFEKSRTAHYEDKQLWCQILISDLMYRYFQFLIWFYHNTNFILSAASQATFLQTLPERPAAYYYPV